MTAAGSSSTRDVVRQPEAQSPTGSRLNGPLDLIPPGCRVIPWGPWQECLESGPVHDGISFFYRLLQVCLEDPLRCLDSGVVGEDPKLLPGEVSPALQGEDRPIRGPGGPSSLARWLGPLPGILALDVFGRPRRHRRDIRRFWEETQLGRWRLGKALARCFRRFFCESGAYCADLVRATNIYLRGERDLEEPGANLLVALPDRIEVEHWIVCQRHGLERLLHAIRWETLDGLDRTTLGSERE